MPLLAFSSFIFYNNSSVFSNLNWSLTAPALPTTVLMGLILAP